MVVGSPVDLCPCRERDMVVGEIAQCKNCKQVYHLRCFRQQREECNCVAKTEAVELKKRSSTIDFDVDMTEPPLPTKKISPSPVIPKGVGQRKDPSSVPNAPPPRPEVKTMADFPQRRAAVLAMYDAKFPLNFSTEIEKNRLKVKRILFEVILGAVEELVHHFHELKFQFSTDKVAAISGYNDEQLFEFARNAAFELEGELIKTSPNPLAKDAVYLKKSRFLSILFKQDKLNQLLVQYLLGWLSAKKLVGLPESEFSDKQKMQTYEARFWDGREIEEEELVLKNYKVD